ncbi:MAG TPA: hypothetical protein PK640_10900, partial [Verrucomicrobiota bacterium]|nr:hypothetical protein [Verrucomicrobiota bacterium]
AVSTAAGSVVIAWPATSTYLLESTAALGPAASWSAVDTSSAVVEGGQKKLTLTPSQAATFYRMKK